MLRLSKLGDYGTVIMAHMAREPLRRFSAAEIATGVGVGLPTVSKLLKRLARDGLLLAHRGSKGGYVLARSPSEISIAQVIDAAEGVIGMTECSATLGLCAQESQCRVRGSWLRINQVVRAVLEEVRLAEFAQPVAMPVDLTAMHAGRRIGPPG